MPLEHFLVLSMILKNQYKKQINLYESFPVSQVKFYSTMGYKYAYLVANIFFLAVWLIIYFRVKYLRRPMLILSLITASFGPISEIWYFADYWKPEIALPLPIVGGVEDLLFGFSIGGIGAFAYESLFVRGICSCFG